LVTVEAKASQLHVPSTITLDRRKGGQASSEDLLPLRYGARERLGEVRPVGTDLQGLSASTPQKS